ncbi:MAG: class I SAM-dependent methyltransferase [Myxococcota bacterium]
MGWYADHVFPWILERAEGPEVHRWRDEVVRPARGDVLEIGFGTGKTLPSYTEAVTSLTIVEPSTAMSGRAAQALAHAPFPTHMHPLQAERLPFDDAQFDAVVCTMTLCSVDHPADVLSELMRVLRPGGRFHFLEHVVSTNPAVRRWQTLLNPLQRVLACGCNYTRDTEASIRAAGFDVERLDRRTSKDMPIPHHALYPVILGVARKPLAP